MNDAASRAMGRHVRHDGDAHPRSDPRPPALDEVSADPLTSVEVGLLTEVGFLASAAGDVERAGMIFAALMALRPRRAFPYIGLALAWLNAGKPAEAVMVFERAPPVDAAELPDLAIYHALALQLASRLGESRRVLAAIDPALASPVVRRLARGMDDGADPRDGGGQRHAAARARGTAGAAGAAGAATAAGVITGVGVAIAAGVAIGAGAITAPGVA
ncbi:MAG: hypothetical protein ACRYGL_02425 [Janthinobacterium lividum]